MLLLFTEGALKHLDKILRRQDRGLTGKVHFRSEAA